MLKIAIAVIALLMFMATSLTGANWKLDNLETSIPRLTIKKTFTDTSIEGICSSVVVNAKKGYALTAAHCVTAEQNGKVDINVNNKKGDILQLLEPLDIALVIFKPYENIKQIALAPNSPPAGTEIALLGYPFGDLKVHAQFGHISVNHSYDSTTLWLNVDAFFGNSGGPIINQSNELVGMTVIRYSEDGAQLVGAVSVEALKVFLEPFLPNDN